MFLQFTDANFVKKQNAMLNGYVYHSIMPPNEKRMIQVRAGALSNYDTVILDPANMQVALETTTGIHDAAGVSPRQIAVADDGSYAYLRDFTSTVFFRSPSGAQLQPKESIDTFSAYALSYYDGHYYAMGDNNNDVKHPLLRQYDLLGNMVASVPLVGVDLYTDSWSNLASSMLVSTYDAAGNIFWTQDLKSGTNKLYKITTQGTVSTVAIDQKYHKTRLETDAIGNVYFIRAASMSASTTTGNYDITITKIKNDMTVEWEKTIPDAAIAGAWYVARNGLIYLFKWADNTKKSYVLNVYQQTTI